MKKEKGKVKFYVYTIQGIKLTFDRVLYILKLFNFTAAGFGLRVVGGKTGTDGRTFAYVMWTLPDGPAAKVGIQRGDKVRISSIFFFSLENLFWLCWHFFLVKRILFFFFTPSLFDAYIEQRDRYGVWKLASQLFRSGAFGSLWMK